MLGVPILKHFRVYEVVDNIWNMLEMRETSTMRVKVRLPFQPYLLTCISNRETKTKEIEKLTPFVLLCSEFVP